jgi:membrane protease YdiL (CAAX protease family)
MQLFTQPAFWFLIFVVLFNNLIDFLPLGLHDTIYLWLNLSLLLIIWWWSKKYLKLSNEDIGFCKKNLLRSLLLGFAVACAVIVPFALILLIRVNLGLAIKGPALPVNTLQHLLWRSIFRIPLGTALFEEMLFRGFAYGFIGKWLSGLKTVLLTSLLFASWHVVPAFKTVRFNFGVGEFLLGSALWAVFLIGSFIAGLIFAWIRYQGKHIAGCILAHAFINSFALILMYIAWHS